MKLKHYVQPILAVTFFKYLSTVVYKHDATCLSVPREWNHAFNAKQLFCVIFISYSTSQVLYRWDMYATGDSSDEQTAKSQTGSGRSVLKPLLKVMWPLHVRVHVFLDSDSSPEDGTLASGTPAVVGKRRGRKSSPQDCDKETAKSQTDSHSKTRSETRPCDGKVYCSRSCGHHMYMYLS